jgi:signal transduction histidine kinase
MLHSDTRFILVVDDNPTNLSVLSQALREAGLEVRIATDGEDALEQVEHKLPTLILLDVQMPGIDGFETCRRLKENPRTQDIPVIFMTALADAESKVKGLTLGAVDYITKPFEQTEVLARVRIHLQLRHLTQTLKDWNGILEQQVADRTAALQSAQIQLIQQEKLSSLGQLVAGIAHEMNNPISCVANNVNPIETYFKDFQHLLELYQQHYPEPVLEIQEALEDADLEFAFKDITKLMTSMQMSTERIHEISLSLRNFARADTTTKTFANIHEGLNSTLLILGHRLKAVGDRAAIALITQYEDDLPDIHCYAGQLNQVFMNLLANAIDALETHPTPEIRIQTELRESAIAIRIADNGMGMTPEVQQKLFQPLFTTKPIGKGTGLGLLISQQIVIEKHGGKLSCNSSLGVGTEFVIELPVS